MNIMRTFIAALAAVLLITAPLAARAQIAPSYAQNGDSADAQIHGRVISFDGGYSLQVRDEKGYVDNVQLHPGTIINPTGITLAPGMIVSILGYNSGSYFGANEIDTPYTFYSGVPYYSGHPWDYYGPSVSLGFFFGNGGWWHGGYFGGAGYRYVGGARVYNNVHINEVYHGGAFQGHAYVAPAASGGYYGGRRSGDFHGNPGGGFHGNPGGGFHGDGGGFHGGGDHHR
jgi:hypothetical protein